MSRLLQNPIVVIALAVLVGTAATIVPLWQAGEALVREIAAAQPDKVQEIRAQGWDFWTIEIDNLASELKEEKSRLAQQSQEQDQRAGRMAVERQELDTLRERIEALQREIDSRVIEVNASEAKNLRGLAQTYATLTPKAAVAIIRELDELIAVKVLSLMKADAVGPIFEEMCKTATPDGTLAPLAATLSDKLRLMRSVSAAQTRSP